MSKQKFELSDLAVERDILAKQVPIPNGSAYPSGTFPPMHAGNSMSSNTRDLLKASDDLPIVVHCHLRWDFVWQRPQQIFSRFARIIR